MKNKTKVYWKVNLPNLFNEILNNNPGMAIFNAPINITGKILYLVAERAKELNDKKLNKLMWRLALYEKKINIPGGDS